MNRLLSFLFVCLISSSLYAQKVDVKKIDSFINYIEKNNQEIGNLSIYKNGQNVYNRSFGQRAIKDLAFNDKTKYQIGSITKMFTAVLIFQLIEKGKLRLDDKLAVYFPEMPNASKIEIKQLLAHSSGLGDFTSKNDSIPWLTEKANNAQILNEIKRQGTFFEPGKGMRYSNSGYYLLAKILEQKYKQNYGQILTTHIIKPNRLENLQSILSKPANIFNSYTYSNNNWKQVKDFDFNNVVGVGDIASTTDDLNKFIVNLFQYRVLKKETVELMKPILGKGIFGMGFMLVPFYEHIYYGHGGDTYGTHSMVAYNEKDSLSVAYAINGERYPKNDFAIAILSIIYNKSVDFPEFNFIQLKEADLEKYFGVYASPQLPIKLDVRKDGNTLIAQGTGQPSFTLEAFGENKFKSDRIGVKIEFFPKEKFLILKQGGVDYKMIKE